MASGAAETQFLFERNKGLFFLFGKVSTTVHDGTASSFGGHLLELSEGVGQSDVELLGASDDVFPVHKRDFSDCDDGFCKNLPLGGGNVLGDFTSVGPVVHEQQFNVFHVSDQKFSEAAGEHMAGGLGLLGTDLGHAHGTSEASSHTAINTSRFSPGFLKTNKCE